MNVMVAANSYYIPFCKVMLSSLFACEGDENIDVYMPYEGLSDGDIADLDNYIKGFEGKRFFPMKVDSTFKERVKSHNGITIETYYRILAIDMLPETVEKILYLDCDMIVQKSIKECYETELGDAYFAVCEDIIGILNGFHEANKIRMNIPPEYSYFNAGIMLMNIAALRNDGVCARILEQIYADFERYEYNDQDVLNEMFYDRLLFLPWQKYNCPPALYIVEKSAAGETEDTEDGDKLLDKNTQDEEPTGFLTYSEIRSAAQNPDEYGEKLVNVTEDLCKAAYIIHFLANTKPWSDSRNDSAVYGIFDKIYYDARKRAGLTPDLPGIMKEYLAQNYTYLYVDGMMKAAVLPEVDTLILGSSYGLTDVDMGVLTTSVNLSVTSADLSTNAKMLKTVLEKRKGGFSRLVLLLGEYALYDDMSKSRMGMEMQKSVYAPLFGESDPWGKIGENSGLCVSDRMKVETAAKELVYSKGNFFNELYVREDNCEEKYKGLVWVTASSDEKQKFADIRTADHNRLYKPENDVFSKNKSCLEEIFSMAEEYNTAIYVVFPPFSIEYEEHINPAMKQELCDFLNETPHMVNLLDFRELVEDGTFTDADFFDMDHLSASGARKFSEYLK